MTPIFVDRLEGDATAFVFDHPFITPCYSDGEGGIQFVPRLVVKDGAAQRWELMPRAWPVP